MKRKKACTETLSKEVLAEQVEEQIKQTLVARNVNPYPPLELPGLQAYYEALHNLLWNRAGLSPEKALEHLTFFFAYRMIEPQVESLGLPAECRWSHVQHFTNSGDTWDCVKRGCSAFQKNPVTKPFFKKPEIEKAEVVYEIIQQIHRIPFSMLEESDTLGDIFEYMLSRGMSTMSDEGQYFTNRKICKLAFDMAYAIKKTVRKPDGSLCTFGDWFCGTGGFAAEYVKGVGRVLGGAVDWKKEARAVCCQDMSLSSITTTLLNMLILTGVPFSSTGRIRSGNSFCDPLIQGAGAPFKEVALDYCFMNPPYGGDKTKGKDFKFKYVATVKDDAGVAVKHYKVNKDIQSIGVEEDDKVSAGVQLSMATLAPGGVCCIVLPQGFFFGAAKKAVELRKKLVEDFKVWSVVDIPSGAFTNTGTKTSLLVFQKGVGATETVRFLDLEGGVLAEASREDIAGKQYVLNYKQYVKREVTEAHGFEMVSLRDLCEIVYGSAKAPEVETGTYPLVGGGIKPTKYVGSWNNEENGVIVSRSGTCGHVSRYPVKSFVASFAYILKPKEDKITASYLYHVLKSREAEIKALGVGTVQKNLNRDTLYEVQVPVPSLAVQQQIMASEGWIQLAQHEEAAVGLLEKQILFELQEMGRGKERVKVGDVCELKTGKSLTKEQLEEGDYPVVGGGLAPMGYHNVSNRDSFAVIVGQVGNAGAISRYPQATWVTNNGLTLHFKNKEFSNDYLYYVMKLNETELRGLGEGTAQPKLSSATLQNFMVYVGSVEEQQQLAAEFVEVRNKYQKISHYKAKADLSLRQMIPGSHH